MSRRILPTAADLPDERGGTPEERTLRVLPVYETAYVVVRFILGLVFVLAYATGEIRLVPSAYRMACDVSFALSTLTTIVSVTALVTRRVPARTVLVAAAAPDLIGIALLIGSTQGIGDPAYVWVLGFAVVYGLLLPIEEAMLAVFAVAAVYVGSYAFAAAAGYAVAPWSTQAAKAVAVGVFGYFTADAVRRNAVREAELIARQTSIEELNARLQRRLDGLTTISSISEVIHSSLDFDAVVPAVATMLRRSIGGPDCEVAVVDMECGDCLFTTAGDPFAAPAAAACRIGERAAAPGMPLADSRSCLALLEGERLSVMLFAPEARIDTITEEDRLVLQSVAGELAVAVENSRLYKLTERLSVTDELTGLHNYRFLQQRLAGEFERAARYERPLSLLMLDVDHFKRLNDRAGHPAGDAILAELATLLRSSVREMDVTARYGGEEFCVLLPEADSGTALKVAEKIRSAVEDHTFTIASVDRLERLTISIGAATYPEHCDGEETLIRQADDALYQAKRDGRNLVRIARGDRVRQRGTA